MEAAVLLGLVAAGYFKNRGENLDNPIITNVDSNVKLTNGKNIYDSGNYYQETKKEVTDLVGKNFNESNNYKSNIINDKNLDRELNVEGFQELIYSSNSGETIANEDFLRNDQGITTQPYFKKAPNPIDFNDTRGLDRHQGDNRLKESKREIGRMFPLEKNENVFGNQFGEYIGDKSRYLNLE